MCERRDVLSAAMAHFATPMRIVFALWNWTLMAAAMIYAMVGKTLRSTMHETAQLRRHGGVKTLGTMVFFATVALTCGGDVSRATDEWSTECELHSQAMGYVGRTGQARMHILAPTITW